MEPNQAVTTAAAVGHLADSARTTPTDPLDKLAVLRTTTPPAQAASLALAHPVVSAKMIHTALADKLAEHNQVVTIAAVVGRPED